MLLKLKGGGPAQSRHNNNFSKLMYRLSKKNFTRTNTYKKYIFVNIPTFSILSYQSINTTFVNSQYR